MECGNDCLPHELEHNDKIQLTINYLVAYLLLANLICVSAVTVGPRDTVLLTLSRGLFFTWLEEEKKKKNKQTAASGKTPADAEPPLLTVPINLNNIPLPTPAGRVGTGHRWRGRCGRKLGGNRPVKKPGT